MKAGEGQATWLRRARDFIEAHHDGDLTIGEVAAVAGVSRVHLSRAFKAAFDMPPRVHLHGVRLQHGMDLLRQGAPIAEVAVRVGFVDQSHFTRRFKIAFGITPGAWLRAHQAFKGETDA
jgi:AraC-like DNA-binding protein